MELIAQIEATVASAKENAEKFYNNGNKAAGTRLRNDMQDLKRLAQEVRVDVMEKKKA